jgi:type II secretory pathway pseudopilin PulG
MKSITSTNRTSGYSIAELAISMTIMLVAMGLTMTLFSRSLNTRTRESSRTDALTSAQAALNVMSREIGNSGYGLIGNGLVLAGDSTDVQLHFRSNYKNDDLTVSAPGEDVTYFWDSTSKSILRYDPNGGGTGIPQTSTIINRVSTVKFEYFDFIGSNSTPIQTIPNATVNTGRVRITVTVNLEQVRNQINPSSVVLTSDVALRNSDYNLRNY